MSARTGEAFRSAERWQEDVAKGAHSKADAVYGELKEAILVRRARAGQPDRQGGPVREARRFALSRSPPRSAGSPTIGWSMSRRSTARSSRGFRSNDVRERLFIRSALEGEIAAEAARRMTRDGQGRARRANLERGGEAVAAGRPERASTRSTSPSTRSDGSSRHGARQRCPRRPARPSGTGAPAD